MSMTRTFKAVAATSLVVAANNEAPTILNIDGYCNGTANTQYWLQLFASATVPNNGTVPLRSLQVLGVDGFTFNKMDVGLAVANLGAAGSNGVNQGNLIVVLSTTDATLTIGSGNVTADINVDVEEYELEVQGLIVVTANNTGAAAIAADPQNPPVALYALQVTDLSGIASYIQLATYIGQVTPTMQWPLAANATVLLKFGATARALSNVSVTPPAAQVTHTGLYVSVSVASGVVGNSGLANFTAWYK